jgi:hypothetical protein
MMKPHTEEELTRLEGLAKAALDNTTLDTYAAYIAALHPAEGLRLIGEHRALLARWEALKAWRIKQQREMPDDANGGGSQVLSDMKVEMTRLEDTP